MLDPDDIACLLRVASFVLAIFIAVITTRFLHIIFQILETQLD